MNSIARKTGLATMALTLSLGLAACGGSDDETTATDTASETTSASPSETPMEEETMEASAADGTFGAGCAGVPTDPSDPGSFEGMALDPVATAASNNDALSTLVTAVTEAGLGDTLNSADGITVFAPTNDAFAAIPKKQLKKVLADKATLTAILTHHVVGERLAPEDLAGTFTTLNGDDLTVEGSGESFTVGSENANVVCGNVQTANATVYIVDSVLMPAS